MHSAFSVYLKGILFIPESIFGMLTVDGLDFIP